MATVWALNVLHRSLVEECFIVEEWTAQKLPVKVYNKFTYEIDKNFKSENMHEDIEKYPRIPAMLFSKTRYNLHMGGPFDDDLLDATQEELELMGWQLLN